MRVRVSLSVEVDRDEWERQYGVDAHMVAVIRDDVRRYVVGAVRDSAAADSGAIVEVRS